MQYVDEQGNPVQVGYAPQPSIQYGASPYPPKPAVFNITPEQFAQIQRGGALSQVGRWVCPGGSLRVLSPERARKAPPPHSSQSAVPETPGCQLTPPWVLLFSNGHSKALASW